LNPIVHYYSEYNKINIIETTFRSILKDHSWGFSHNTCNHIWESVAYNKTTDILHILFEIHNMLPCILTNSCIHLWSKHGFICRVVRDFFECWIKMHTGLNIFLKQTTTENDQASEQRLLNTFDSTGFPQRFRL